MEPRPTCLISRNLLNERQNPSFVSGSSNVSWNPELDSNSLSGSTRKLVRDRVQNPATSFQEWKKDNPFLGSERKLVRSDVCERSGSFGKPVRGVEKRLDFHNMQILR